MIRRHLGTAVIILVLVSLLGWAFWIMVTAWTHIDAKMSGHGWAALILGIVFSCVLGFGLMGLMFFSSRHGYDEAVKSLDRPSPDDN
jgi:hypothetical protein